MDEGGEGASGGRGEGEGATNVTCENSGKQKRKEHWRMRTHRNPSPRLAAPALPILFIHRSSSWRDAWCLKKMIHFINRDDHRASKCAKLQKTRQVAANQIKKMMASDTPCHNESFVTENCRHIKTMQKEERKKKKKRYIAKKKQKTKTKKQKQKTNKMSGKRERGIVRLTRP